MVGEGADDADRLLETMFDLEAQAVEANDFGGTQGRVLHSALLGDDLSAISAGHFF